MKLKTILFAFMSFPLLWSCDKQEIPMFESDDAGIYFQKRTSYSGSTENYTDSAYFSFAGASAQYTSFEQSVPVLTMGKVSDYDRPFKLVVDKEESTAIEGEDFEIDHDVFVIKAGTSRTEVPVRLIRTNRLLEDTLKIVLRLEENEHFKCYLETYKGSSSYADWGKTVNAVRYVFTFSEKYTEPNFWKSNAKNYFGEWTVQKFKLINEVCGFSLTTWEYTNVTGNKLTAARLPFFAKFMQSYLQEQADAGNPETELNGDYMQLAPNYEVDYSKYQ